MPLHSSPSREPLLAQTLAAIQHDMRQDAGARFVELVCRYYETSRVSGSPGSAAPGASDIVARFAGEPPMVGRSLGEVVQALERDVMQDSLRLAHPGALCAPLASPLPVSAWCEALIAAMNQSMRTWWMSPTGTSLETGLVRWMTQLVGWDSRAGGSFTSGATESNFTALLAARGHAEPASWQKGLASGRLVVIAGENAYFNIAHAVAMLGLGTERLVNVGLRDHRMDPGALDASLRAQARTGRHVMAVVATAGASTTGVFDDLQAIGEVCEAHGVWLHVDAAIGGTALLSSTQRHRLRGIERARSVAWDLHKLAMIPLQTAVLLMKDERDLEMAFCPAAAGHEPRARSWDQGSRTFLNSRRFDALKLWAALLRHGVAGLGALYDHLCRLADMLHQEVCRRPDFEPLRTPECSLLAFRYVGQDGRRDEAALDELNRRLWRQALIDGHAFLSAPMVDGHAALLAAMTNPFLTGDEIAHLLDGLGALGASLTRSQ